MIYLRLMLSIMVPLLLGLCIIAFIYRNKEGTAFLERLSLAWGIGIGLLGLEMFTISLLGIALNLQTILIPTLVIVAIFIVYLSFNKIPIFGWKPAPIGSGRFPKSAEIFLILLISLTIAYVFFDALVKPILNFDDLWRQGCIAKIVFSTGRVLTKQTVELAATHPYLNPLSQAWIYLCIGTWNDALGKIIFPLCFTSLIFIFYSNLRKSFPRLYSLLFTYLLSSFPLIVYHAGTAYSDFMQAFYYSSGAIYLFQWIRKKEHSSLFISALFLGIGNFVKVSGIPLWAAAAFVLLIYLMLESKKELKMGGKFILLSAIISSPWLFYKDSFLMNQMGRLGQRILGSATITGAEIPAAANLSHGSPALYDILYHLGRRMFTYADWNILWFMFILAVIFSWQHIWESKLKYLLLLIILDLAMVVYAFLDPTAYQFLVDGTLVNRILMHQIPLVLFFVAFCFSEYFAAKAGDEQT